MNISHVSSTPSQQTMVHAQRALTQQSTKIDSDGDHDGSKPGEVEPAKGSTATLGTQINTFA